MWQSSLYLTPFRKQQQIIGQNDVLFFLPWPVECLNSFSTDRTIIMRPPCSARISMKRLDMSTQYRRVTDGQTDGQTFRLYDEMHSILHASHHRVGKNRLLCGPPWGRIKCCTPSVCLSVRPAPQSLSSLSPSITPSPVYSRLKLICSTNPFLHILSSSIQTLCKCRT